MDDSSLNNEKVDLICTQGESFYNSEIEIVVSLLNFKLDWVYVAHIKDEDLIHYSDLEKRVESFLSKFFDLNKLEPYRIQLYRGDGPW